MSFLFIQVGAGGVDHDPDAACFRYFGVAVEEFVEGLQSVFVLLTHRNMIILMVCPPKPQTSILDLNLTNHIWSIYISMMISINNRKHWNDRINPFPCTLCSFSECFSLFSCRLRSSRTSNSPNSPAILLDFLFLAELPRPCARQSSNRFALAFFHACCSTIGLSRP